MASTDSLAMPPGADPRQLSRQLGRLHDSFVSSGAVDPALRPVVSESWRRSVRSGVDPERSMARLPLDDARLADARVAHPLAVGMPVIRRLLVEEASEAGLLVAVSDAAGQLLWVEGDPVLRAQAEDMHFLAGADWSEESAGTNAPGHRAGPRPTGADLRPRAPGSAPSPPGAAPRHRSANRTPARSSGCWTSPAVSRWRARRRSPWSGPLSPPSRRSCGSSRLMVPYGPAGPRLESASAPAAGGAGPPFGPFLAPRHHDRAQPAAQRDHVAPGRLAGRSVTAPSWGSRSVDDDQATVTIRAELSRLRARSAGAPGVASVPAATATSDIDDLRADLQRDVSGPPSRGTAVRCFRTSSAPGVERIRDDLHRPAPRSSCSQAAIPTPCWRSPTPRTVATTSTSGRGRAGGAPRRPRPAARGERAPRTWTAASADTSPSGLRAVSGAVAQVTIAATAAQPCPPSVPADAVGGRLRGETAGPPGQTRSHHHDCVRSPGTEGSVVSYRSRYDHWIGGEWVAAGQGPVLREPVAGHRQDVLRGRPGHRRGHRARPGRRARRRPGLGQDLGHRARRTSSTRSPTGSRRTWRCWPSARPGTTASRSARPWPPTCRWPSTTSATSPARCAPRRAASPRSTTTPSRTTSTSRSAWSGRSSRGTSRS